MGRVLDLTAGGKRLEVRMEVGTSYELLSSLCAFCHGPADVATFDGGTVRHRQAKRLASPELLEGIDRLGRRAGKAWVNLLGVAAAHPPARLVPGLLERLAELDAVELRFTLLGGHVPAYQSTVHRGVICRAAEGDAEAAAVLRNDRSYFGGEARLLERLLRLSVAETRRLALDVLGRWHAEVFRHDETETAEALGREAEARRDVLACEESRRAIELITGVKMVRDSAVDEVVLIPQLAMRPWLLLCEYDTTRLFCYPASASTEPSPRAAVLAFGRALADPKRIQMLEAIAERPVRVADLSARFDLPTSTTYHHLAILRSAGLIRVSSDLDRRYSIKPDALEEVMSALHTLTSPAEHRGGDA
jgi:DNA-binding transcriptional ArsR family regulator